MIETIKLKIKTVLKCLLLGLFDCIIAENIPELIKKEKIDIIAKQILIAPKIFGPNFLASIIPTSNPQLCLPIFPL